MMNLAELKANVIEKLKERSDPRHWSMDAIVRYLNRGCRRMAMKGAGREQVLPLAAADIQNGLFLFPQNILRRKAVYWNGKSIPQTSADYLDSLYRGDVRDFQIGSAQDGFQDWRVETAESPTKWLIDDGQIRLYPIPTALSAASPIRSVQSALLAAGDTDIVLGTPLPSDVVDPVPAPLPPLPPLRTVHETVLVAGNVDITIVGSIHENQNLVDVFANGVYQNKDQWSRISSDTIRMVGSFAVDQDIEIVQYGLVPFYSTKPTKYVFSLPAGTTAIPIPNGYTLGENAVALLINGIKQAPSAYTETDAYTVTLVTALVVDSQVEVNVYSRYVDAFHGNKDLVDVFANGVYQNKGQWSIIAVDTIRMVGPFAVDQDIEVVYWSQGRTTGMKHIKYTMTKLAGTQTIVTPRPYEINNNAISIRINGITQSPSAFTETSPNTITLAAALVFDAEIEITIYERTWAGNAAIRVLRQPTDMVSDSDYPDLPDHANSYHDASWQWALYEAYSREGQEQDPNRAAMYLSMFNSTLQEFLEAFMPSIETSPRDPWNI